VRLLLHLGQCSTQTLEMRWQDLDLVADIPTWTIPGAYRKGQRLHVVPLPSLVIRIIEGLRSISGSQERVLHGVSVDNPHRWFDPIRDRAKDRCDGRPHVDRFTPHDCAARARRA
jgi:integrase